MKVEYIVHRKYSLLTYNPFGCHNGTESKAFAIVSGMLDFYGVYLTGIGDDMSAWDTIYTLGYDRDFVLGSCV